MNLADRHRPNHWSEVVGQARALAVLDRLRERGGLAGRGYWVSGKSGTGKTTIARLLAREVAPPFATVELDAQALTPAALRRIEDECAGKPLGGRGWCYVVNEAHGLSCDSIRKLLTMFDELPAFVTWIFTTTTQGQARFDGMADGGPLLSRLTVLELQADPRGVGGPGAGAGPAGGIGRPAAAGLPGAPVAVEVQPPGCAPGHRERGDAGHRQTRRTGAA